MLDKPKGNLSNVVAALFDKFAGDDERIERALRREAERNSDIMQEIIDLGINQIIRNQYTARRSGWVPEPAMSDQQREEGLEKYETRKAKLWEVYSLYGHMSLIEARVADLRESASKRKQMADTLMARSDFETALADRMGTSDKSVGKFFKLADVVKLAERYHAV